MYLRKGHYPLQLRGGLGDSPGKTLIRGSDGPEKRIPDQCILSDHLGNKL